MLYEVDNGVSATLHFAENIFSAASSATAASSYFFTNKIDVDLIDRSNQKCTWPESTPIRGLWTTLKWKLRQHNTYCVEADIIKKVHCTVFDDFWKIPIFYRISNLAGSTVWFAIGWETARHAWLVGRASQISIIVWLLLRKRRRSQLAPHSARKRKISATLHFAENIFSAASSATAASSYFFTNKIDVDLIDRSNPSVHRHIWCVQKDYSTFWSAAQFGRCTPLFSIFSFLFSSFLNQNIDFFHRYLTILATLLLLRQK